MLFFQEMWARGQIAQQAALQVTTRNTMMMTNAIAQFMQLGLNGPRLFWEAFDQSNAKEGEPYHAPSRATMVETVTEKLPEAAAETVAETQIALQDVVAFPPVQTPEAQLQQKSTASLAAKDEFLLDAPRNGSADPLTELKGLGDKLAGALNDFGIYHFDQIASLTPDQVDWIDGHQKGFKMTATRYDLTGQARARLA